MSERLTNFKNCKICRSNPSKHTSTGDTARQERVQLECRTV
ncbi:uncharacterized protein HfgLR_23970 (plasmid) [Haloferax gibbonsii]|uniref:Uncharacterized protein n=1 Tax=Haloferax gibbonsii TaxID=35746 RepID=A0A871BMJ5_HALGI|nr:uncharacterized protein HfgLR_23970 [Haloferax gibbonsii]